MADTNDVGRRLNRWRLARDLPLRQVAILLKTSSTTIHRWEKGKARPNERSSFRIRRLLAGRAA